MNLRELFHHLLHKIPSNRFFKLYSTYYNRSNWGMVITLHSVQPGSSTGGFNSFIEISAERFEQTLLDLQQLNVRFVNLKELEAVLGNNHLSIQHPPLVHISFDDGYLDTYTVAYPILKKYGIPFSVFVVSDFMNNPDPFLWWYMIARIIENRVPVYIEKYAFTITAEQYRSTKPEALFLLFRQFVVEKVNIDRNYLEAELRKYLPEQCVLPAMLDWAQLNEMMASGLCEAGVHTQTHPRFGLIPDAQKIYEIEACKQAIAEHTHTTPVYFAYPYGGKEDIGETGLLAPILEKTGMRMALTTIPGLLNQQVPKHLVPRIFLNDATTAYTLKVRLSGMYQRSVS